ncbi:hypothetical protein PWG71_14905 [Nocardiopsis sp. N85]|uniref:hypothetical protein n=1 Tax=Nocardiopsis sp. N85 TaxID=3029400 RepID=UPI00237F944A|nr:hypothetical protein [Nocardiopsis sp. N85]MDE3722677.1 hypothetical protein [Nocardiopsis sp. N85]
MPETVPAGQPHSRGCAAVGVILAAVLLLGAAGGAAWYVLTREDPETGAYDAAPGCEVGETGALDARVPDHEPTLEEPLGTAVDVFGQGWQCRWATPGGDGDSVPATATLVLVAAPNPGGVPTARDNFDSTTSRHATTPVEDLGEESVAWIAEDVYTTACVATRVSNLYVETCHSTAAGYDAREPADEERVIAGAEEIARATVAALPDEVVGEGD